MAELARGEQPQLTSGPVRLDSIVLEAVEVATTHGRSRGVVFDAQVAPTWVSGSTARIGRAVDNLLDNALKWSPDGGVVEVACSGGTLIVRDHGPGVADSDSPSSSTASTGPRVPGPSPAPAWDWPSWPRWPRTRAAA